MPPTFADMKQENVGLQENIDEFKADKKTLTEKIMSISKHMVCFTKQYCTDIIKLFLLPFITNVQRLNTGI